MRYIKTYEKLTSEHKLLKGLFLVAYEKAMKHFNKISKKTYISEDHVLHFINHYMLNNYGIDIPHSKEMYNYIKVQLHKKFVSQKG
jgi:hypothetical protein